MITCIVKLMILFLNFIKVIAKSLDKQKTQRPGNVFTSASEDGLFHIVTHLLLDKMATILQTMFLNACSGMKMFDFR